MLVPAARFASLLTTALALGLAWCHVAEIAGKLRLPPEVWVTIQQNLYMAFAPMGAIAYLASIVTAWVVVFLVWRRPARRWSLAGAILATLGLLSWFALVAPVNTEIAALSPTTIPPDWQSIRLRWEIGHALGFVLFLGAFVSLVASVLGETADRREAGTRAAPFSRGR